MERLTNQDILADATLVVNIDGNQVVAGVASSFYQRRGKRLLDLTLGIPLFLMFVPVMILVGLAVLVTSGWPVFYSSERAGKGGKPVPIWKFRTMVLDADNMMERWKETHPDLSKQYQNEFKLKDDPRIIPLGRILRKLSLDELPQLASVVCGQMSLVGPRPYFMAELNPYPDTRRAICSVLPGVTGPWQVAGRNSLSPTVRMELDVEYTSKVTFMTDLEYLVHTLKPAAWLNGM